MKTRVIHPPIYVNEYYQHFKGKKYKVIALARDSETMEEMVVYQGQYASIEFGGNPVWIRPRHDFIKLIKRDNYEGPRFKHLGKELPKE